MSQTRILFVEDNADIREAVAEALVEAGLDVTATDGELAARQLMESGGFHLLVTDIHLATRLAGLQLVQHWRKHHTGLPVVYATAYPRVAINVGALGPRDAYLVKPYRPSELLGLIRFVLRPPLQEMVVPSLIPLKSAALSRETTPSPRDTEPWLADSAFAMAQRA